MPQKIDKAKLNKILWYSDIYSYRDLGGCITTAKYEKGESGVVVSDGKLEKALAFLIAEKSIICRDGLLVEVKKANAKLYTFNEKIVITSVIKSVCSGRTKNFFWWDSLEIGEKIPMNCVFAVAGEINSSDMEWAKGNIINKDGV